MFPGSERVQIFQIQSYRHKKKIVKLIKLHLQNIPTVRWK